jgi:hypothetical protein
MGYQIVNVRPQGEESYEAFVFNADLLVYPAELPGLTDRSYDDLVDESPELPRTTKITTLPTGERGAQTVWEIAQVAEDPTFPSTRIWRRRTSHFDGFKRFSAYRNDRRITPKRGLVAGSYVTSVSDVQAVPNGLAAVGRYALPNPWPAVFVYTIVPVSGISIQSGTVRPNFGQSGGGVEILFVDPAPAGSVCGPYQITEI